MTAETLLASDFATLPDLIRAHAKERGNKLALVSEAGSMDYAALHVMKYRVASALQRDG